MNTKQRGILDSEVQMFLGEIPMGALTAAQGKLLTDYIHVLWEMLSGHEETETGLRRLDGLAGAAKALNGGRCSQCGHKKTTEETHEIHKR
jgi:hypothetical protein